jgi:hypothetical protein
MLRSRAGLSGYGLYWIVIEHLRNETGYKIALDHIDAICFSAQCDRSFFEYLFECGLLQKDGSCFFSPSLLRRMNEWDGKREALKAAGHKGGKQRSSNAQARLKGGSSY